MAMTSVSTYAQSSVMLYGIVDVGLSDVSSAQTAGVGQHPNGGSQIALTDATATGLSGSRWGLRGEENLCGRLSAIFVLEDGLTANNGAFAQGGAEFGRQAFVGLSSARAGSVTAGRQCGPVIFSLQQFSAPYWAGYISAHIGDIDNLANTNRINNSVKYVTPSFVGLRVGAPYSFGGAGSETQNQIWSLAVNYSGSKLSLGAGYLIAPNPNVSFYGNTPNKGLSTAENIGSFGAIAVPEASPAFSGYASANTLEILGAGASYVLNQTIVSAVVTNTRYEGLGSMSGPNPLGYSGSAYFTSAELGVRTMITPSLLTDAAFDYTQRNSVKDDGGARYLQLDFAIDYGLSASADVYALAVLQRASGRDSLGQSSVATINGFSPSDTDNQLALRVGIRGKS